MWMISQPLFEKLLFSIDCDSLRGPQLANANRLKKKKTIKGLAQMEHTSCTLPHKIGKC